MESWYELINQYGYIAIFCILALGIVGLPIPDEVLLTYLGYLTAIEMIAFPYTLIAALAGSICGITFNYFLGIKLGEPFLRKYGSKFFIREKTIQRTNRLFNKYGPFVLFICYFVPGVRHVAAYFAGITKFSYKRFVLYAYTGALVWVMTFLFLGNRLGSNWEIISRYIHEYIWFIVVLLVIITVVLICYFILRHRKGKLPS